MAKAQTRKSGTTSKSMSSSKTTKFMTNIWSKPVTRYIAGGVGLFVLTKLGMRIYNTYPAVSEFIQESIDTVESKLTEFKEGIQSSSTSGDDSLNA